MSEPEPYVLERAEQVLQHIRKKDPRGDYYLKVPNVREGYLARAVSIRKRRRWWFDREVASIFRSDWGSHLIDIKDRRLITSEDDSELSFAFSDT